LKKKTAQKISTEGKAKIQLQVVLHDDTSSTFHFISPAGQQQQLKDRGWKKNLKHCFKNFCFPVLYSTNFVSSIDQVKDQLGKLNPNRMPHTNNIFNINIW
jgi:hypothetical protein